MAPANENFDRASSFSGINPSPSGIYFFIFYNFACFATAVSCNGVAMRDHGWQLLGLRSRRGAAVLALATAILAASGGSAARCLVKPSVDAVAKMTPPDQDVAIVHTGRVTYRIPKVFVAIPSPSYPELRFTYPGFRPSPDACQDTHPPGCYVVELVLGNGYPIGTSLTPKAWKDREQNILKLSPPNPTRLGQYSVYGRNDRDGGLKFYYSNFHGRKVILDCTVGSMNGIDTSICTDIYFLSDGNSVHIRFERVLIDPSNPNKIEDDVERLMSHFRRVNNDGAK